MNSSPERDFAIKRLKAKRDLRQLAGVAVFVAVVIVTIWWATGADYFWPMWPMIGMGVALTAAWRVWGPGERPIAEDEIAEEMRRA